VFEFKYELELLGFVEALFEGVVSFLFLLSLLALFTLERSMQLLLEFKFLLILLLVSLYLFYLLVMVVVLYKAIIDFLTLPRGD
jgi:hypothetical protein